LIGAGVLGPETGGVLHIGAIEGRALWPRGILEPVWRMEMKGLFDDTDKFFGEFL
jgi:hypothetical protein